MWPLYSIYSYEKHSERNYSDYGRNRAVFFTMTGYPCTWHSPSKDFVKKEKRNQNQCHFILLGYEAA
jgi:hypothetical protein